MSTSLLANKNEINSTVSLQMQTLGLSAFGQTNGIQQIMATQNILNSLTPEQRLIAQQLAAESIQMSLFQQQHQHHQQELPKNLKSQFQILRQQQYGPDINNDNKMILNQNQKMNQATDHLHQRAESPLSKKHSSKLELSKSAQHDWSILLNKLVNGTSVNKKEITNNLSNLLYSNKTCQWPGCTSSHLKFDSFESFLHSHLVKVHKLDEESHGQVLQQINLIEKIETELNKQKQVLNEMLNHLNNQLNIIKHNQQQEFVIFNQQQQKNENPLILAAIAAAAAASSSSSASNDNNNKENTVKIEIESENDSKQLNVNLMNNNLTVAAHLFSANNTNTNVMPILNSSSLSTYSMPNQQRKQLEKSPISLGNG